MKLRHATTPVLFLYGLLATACTMGSGDDTSDVGQAKKVEPSDGVAVLTVTVPADLALQTSSAAPFPKLLPNSNGNGEWVFDYVLGTDHVTVEPGTPVSVRPGGCLFTVYHELTNGGYGLVADKDCDLGLAADQKTTIELGGVRVHYDKDPLAVDFGRRATPHLVDSKGNAAFTILGGQGFGQWPSYSEPQPDEAWVFNDVYGGTGGFVAVPIRPGKYTMDFGVPGIAASKSVTVSAGKIADVDTTPPDIRSTVHFDDDDPSAFPEAALQILTLTVEGDANEGNIRLETGGLDAKFFPQGASSDTVTYVLDHGDSKSVKVPAHGTGKAVLSRIDVDDVAVSDGGSTVKIGGTWMLERQESNGDWETFNTCASTTSENRCTGGRGAGGLATGRGLYVPDGEYRVTVSYKTAADPDTQTKVYPVSIP